MNANVSQKRTNNVNPIQAFFLLGSSGVGKSHVARRLEALNFLHLDIDQRHGFGANGLRREWHHFSSRSDARPLADALKRRAEATAKRGVFISLPSTRIVNFGQVEIARESGISTVLLWGPQELCRSARRNRDEVEGRAFDGGRYDRSNAEAFRVYGSAEFDVFRIAVFDPHGARRSSEDIVATIIEALANTGLQPTAPVAS
ncbi:MAG: hypothetical protein HYX76_07140 [Acidobacteria bacterium]|nr:hypothetical protein [Acidobacteriota bacterium]